eukprot:5745911-Heterocapsa_arctica.AAC.1
MVLCGRACLGCGPGSGAGPGVGLARRPAPHACRQAVPLPTQTRRPHALLGSGRQVGWHLLPHVPAR